MTEENNPEEIRKAQREVALKNLGASHLTDLAGAYFVNSSGAYGEAGDSAVEAHKYFPALNSGGKFYDFESGKEVDLMRNSLLGSRQDGRRYSGNVSEFGIIKNSASIVQESLARVKLKDVLELVGSGKEVKGDYKDKYVSDLLNGDDGAKSIAKQVMGSYIQYFTDVKVSEALGENSKSVVGNLEKILTEPETSS